MINVSQAYKDTLATARRNFNAIINITLADGTVLPQLTNANLRAFSIEDAVSEDDSFTMLGSTIINQCTITLDNIDEDYSQYVFRNAEVSVFIDYPLINGTTERIRKGTYFVDDAKYTSGTVQLICLDYMARFNVPYTKSALAYPATVQDVIIDACITCGVAFVQTDVPHKTFVLPRKPTAEQTSFRQILGCVAQVIGCYARCNRFGQLEFKWCDRNALETAYAFPDKIDIHNLVHNHSQTIAIDDITITGVSIDIESSAFESTAQDETVSIQWVDGKLIMRYPSAMLTTIHSDETGHVIQNKDEDSDADYYLRQDDLYLESEITPSESKNQAINKYLAGSDTYVITITKNELITNEIAGEVATWLALQLVGLRFRKATTQHLGNPTMEAGDVAIMWDRKGRHYPIIVTRTVFGIGVLQTTVCGSENPQKNAVMQYSNSTKTFIKLAEQLRREKTTREIALQELATTLANSPGLYSTIQAGTSGNIYYLHDKETLAESTIIWKMTAEAWGVSSDGGATWNGGMTVDGDVIARILTATGVNADWINTGAISIRKMVSGTSQEVFYANVDTGAVRIVADEFSLTGGDTIESIAQLIAESEVGSLILGGRNLLAFAKMLSSEKLPRSVFGLTITHDNDGWIRIAGTVNITTSGLKVLVLFGIPNIAGSQASSQTSPLECLAGTYTLTVENDNILDGTEDIRVTVSVVDINADTGKRVYTQYVITEAQTLTFEAGHHVHNISIVTNQVTHGRTLNGGIRLKLEHGNKATDWIPAPEDVQSNIDKKIETWYQTTDPSVNWTTAELRSAHTSDLWYNTTDNTTWYYDGINWVQQNVPTAVFDEIDGKAAIFVGSTTPTNPTEGDLWFKGATEPILTYVNSSWVEYNKYTDDSAVTALDNSLNQTEVFNRLTNNGETQGIYLQNGKLYLNFDYAVGQTLKLGGLNNANGTLQIYDADGTEVGLMDNHGAEYKGIVWYRYGPTLQYHRDVNLSTLITRSALAFFINGKLKSVFSHFPISIGANDDISTIYDAYISSGNVSDENASPLYLNLGQNGFVMEMTARTSSSSSSYAVTTPFKTQYNKMTRAGITSTGSYGNDSIYGAIIELYHEIRCGRLFATDSISIIGSAYHFYENGVRVALSSSSSKRYKHDINKLTDKNLDAHKLLKLKPKQFVYNDDAKLQYADMKDELIPGFIAEEVDEIYPAAVIHNDDGEIESWDERRLIPGMLQLIQEQHDEIAMLKATVDRLEMLVHTLLDDRR